MVALALGIVVRHYARTCLTAPRNAHAVLHKYLRVRAGRQTPLSLAMTPLHSNRTVGIRRRDTIEGRWTRIHGFRPKVHSQFLDRRSHRSRQEHARRSALAAVRRHHPARVSRAIARRHGPGARARDHDQGPGRGHQLHAGRPGLRAELDRHAGARRLPLRSFAQSGGLRGSDSAGRRDAGRAGPDGRQCLSGGEQ